ncbi:MAG: phosphatase PAP2 family protein [Spirochaetaceae bacterium]|jgi:membrane-associated phospholipid phosphatase|nr:phosphatase PAP2 family protein [Spirochaetaceae bacterium]
MKRYIILLSITAGVLLVVASFFDLQIAVWLYNPNSSFSEFFEAAGMLPQIGVELIAPAMLFAVLFEKRRTMKTSTVITVFAALLCIAVFLYGTVVYVYVQRSKAPAAVLAVIACVVMFLFFLAALPFAKKKPDELLAVALTGLIALTFGYTILQALKTIWGRQRFYTFYTMDNIAEQFTKWYIPQGGGGADDFKSFPSGHSFAAMCAVWFAFWPRFIDGLKKYTGLILALALLFGLTVMVSRMIYGRHFLSDVTVGAALGLASFALAKSLVHKYFTRSGAWR